MIPVHRLRPPRRVRFAATILVATLVVTAAPAQDEVEVAIAERVLVPRAHWPVWIEAVRGAEDGAAAVCAGLGPDQVEVLEDGESRPVTALGPRPLPRTHALLIDTSRSMSDSEMLEPVKAAAVKYVDSLPPDDSVIVAFFDENLVLGSPLGSGREAARRSIRDLDRTGYATAIWDALYYLTLYMRTVPGEKVILLLTDGEDTASLPENTPGRVADLAASSRDLTVFSIRLGRPTASGGVAASARAGLSALARHTAGDYFEIGEASQLDRIYGRIQDRLDRRSYVSYVPRPFGEGPRDEPGKVGFRWREVRVRARADLPCTITVLRDRRRFEGEPGARATITRPVAYFRDSGGPGAITGRARDLLREIGTLYDADGIRRRGKANAVRGGAPSFSMRDVTLITPPLASLVSDLRGPEDLLAHLLATGPAIQSGGSETPPARAPFIVHGQTFLEVREILGQTLLDQRSDYRAWVEERVGELVESEIRALAQRMPAGAGLTPDRRASLGRALKERAMSAGTGAARGYLSEWLGDVDARKTIEELERRAAASWLEGDTELAGTVEAGWGSLRAWFPPATAVRVLTPLVPVRAAAGDRIGFYRFLLRWPRLHDREPATLPGRPLGLLTVRWLAGHAETAPALEGARVETLLYPPDGRRELRGVLCPDGRPGAPEGSRLVSLDLVWSDDAAGPPVRLTARFPDPGEEDPGFIPEPACLTVDLPSDADRQTRGRALALIDALAVAGRLASPNGG